MSLNHHLCETDARPERAGGIRRLYLFSINKNL